MSNEAINWHAIGAQLRAPFDPTAVDFRPQGNPNSSGKAQAVCYIDARVVADRLDAVVGPGAWSFHYEPLIVEKGEIQLAKGALTIHGITKEDVGDGSNFATSKGCVSDALKRAAVLWGVGRYLYEIESEWVTLDQHKRIPDEVVRRLRAKLPRPDGVAPAALVAPAAATAVVNTDDEPATPEQQERMRKYREALGISEKAMAVADNRLRYSAAETRIAEYIRQWKHTKQLQKVR